MLTRVWTWCSLSKEEGTANTELNKIRTAVITETLWWLRLRQKMPGRRLRCVRCVTRWIMAYQHKTSEVWLNYNALRWRVAWDEGGNGRQEVVGARLLKWVM